MRDEIDNARRAVADDGVPRGPMTIGSLETTTAIRLSPILAAYVASNPDVDVTLRADTTTELIQSVLQRGLEGAFVCGPVHHPELIEETIFREELVVMAPPSSRSLDMLLSQSNLRIVVLRAGCSYRQRLEDILARRGVVGLRLQEFGTLEAISAASRRVSAFPCCQGRWLVRSCDRPSCDPCAAGKRSDSGDRLHSSPRRLLSSALSAFLQPAPGRPCSPRRRNPGRLK